MKVTLRPHSGVAPLEITREEYDRLTTKTAGGWSRCSDETEWLAKLHYLREGFRQEKLDGPQFEEREFRLVLNWLRQSIY